MSTHRRRALHLTLALSLLVVAACHPMRVQPAPLQALPQDKTRRPQNAESYWRERSDLIKAPPLRSAEALRLPPLKRFALDNGLPVLLTGDRGLPLVNVQLVIRTGAIADPADKVGLAEFVAAMLRQGTQRMSADEISATVDSAGAHLGASSGYELTSIECSGRREALDLCLRLVADLAIRPTFPAQEMAEVRDQLLADVKDTRDDPERLASAHFDNLLFGDDHPGGQPMTEASVKTISREDLVRVHRTHFVPGQAILSVSGDVDFAAPELTTAVRQAFSSWRASPLPPAPTARASNPPPGLKILLVDKPDLSQSFFALGHLGISRTNPARDAVGAMNYVLGGGGFSSRLTEVVRAKGGKTYGISSRFFKAQNDGSFTVESFTRNSEILATLRLVQQELNRIIAQPPSAAELIAAKGKLAGGFPIQLETSAALANRLVQAQIWGLPDSEVTEYPVRIHRLNSEQIAQAAAQHIFPHQLIAVIVGKAAEVAPQLRKAGLAFEQISYLDPISARERKRAAQREQVTISPAEQQRARPVLLRALKAAGGAKRLAAVRSLRLSGSARVESKGESLSGDYQALLLYPDHMRLALATSPAKMVQVLAGDRAFLQLADQRKSLPAEVVQRWQGALWREPPLVLLHALDSKARFRLAPTPEPEAQRVAVEVYPPGLPSATLVFDQRSGYLVEIRHVDRTAQMRSTKLGEHRRVKGLLIPHRVVAVDGGRTQTIEYTKVEVNPSLELRDITGEAPPK